MGKEMRVYDIFPRIVRTQSDAVITVRPLFDHVRFTEGQTYTVSLIPAEGIKGQTRHPQIEPIPLVPQAGCLKIPCHFYSEQEYILLVMYEERTLAEFRLYALEEDLFIRRPYKGDMHMHSFRSDGKESPAYVAAACREIGLDFMAITDHHRYYPSLEAIEAYRGLPIDLRLYPGEEVHPPANPVHTINFGGSFSVNELFDDTYVQEVQTISEGLSNIPAETDAYPYASCVWVYNKIRQGGGLAIFCHPYWFAGHRYDVPLEVSNMIFERQPYDALEVIGGYHRYELESNSLQVARYYEERAKGKRIPVVGVSDSHGCNPDDLFGWYYTIVFAPSSELPDLIQNIKDCYAVAIEAVPEERTNAFGPFRMVQYAHYLLREVLPWHDELCREEGRLMLAYAAGNTQAADMLAKLQGQTKALYEHWWQNL